MEEDMMCWLGADRAGLQVRYYEPTQLLHGTTWARVSYEFADAVMHAWRLAIDEIDPD